MQGIKSPELKLKAINLRKQGKSYKDIRKKLGIPLSTLNGWLRDIPITKQQQEELDRRWRQALVRARMEAVKSHNTQKAERFALAKYEADTVIDAISTKDHSSLELALAFLYLGEGSKSDGKMSLGNSNAVVLRFFLRCLYVLYDVPPEKIRCFLHLRADQDDREMKRYWSNTLGISLQQFGKTSFDARTKGSVTYTSYKGVCVVSCSQVAIQRRLMYIADGFCERLANQKQ